MESTEKEVISFFMKHKVINTPDIHAIVNKPDYLADEAFFLMEAFFKQFNIDKGFIDIDLYFNPLPESMFKGLWKKNKSIALQTKPVITIEHLIKVAKTKTWFDPK